jgi:hypothetical protein
MPVKTFLQRDGRLIAKNGKFVVADNPADCECCEPPCGVSASSGGQGVTVTDYAMPTRGGDVEFRYDSFGIPDAYKIEGGGQVFIDTGPVSGQGTRTFNKPQGLKKVTVTVTGPQGTAWRYFLGCPPETRDGDNPLP